MDIRKCSLWCGSLGRNLWLAGTCNNDACIFQEERNIATFTLDRKIIAEKIRTALNEKKEQLQESVTYKNGMKKKNPWKNIENFNNYYCKKYDFNIIE